MATNDPSAYGISIRCMSDADDLFTSVTGIDLLIQDIFHVITQKDFLGPGGDDRGIDVRDFIGMSDDELASQAPLVAEVIARDDRIDYADVVLTAISTNGLLDVMVAVTGYSSLGPFDFTKSILNILGTFGDPES